MHPAPYNALTIYVLHPQRQEHSRVGARAQRVQLRVRQAQPEGSLALRAGRGHLVRRTVLPLGILVRDGTLHEEEGTSRVRVLKRATRQAQSQPIRVPLKRVKAQNVLHVLACHVISPSCGDLMVVTCMASHDPFPITLPTGTAPCACGTSTPGPPLAALWATPRMCCRSPSLLTTARWV